MVVLNQFYQIIEARTSGISPLWKVAHIVAFAVAAVCSFLTAFTFGTILDNFGYNCILNADLEFDNTTFLNYTVNNSIKQVRAIDLAWTHWGPFSDCNFAQFTPLVMMISALVWGTYFTVMSRGGAGYPTDLLSRPWTILYPCLIFSVIFFITYVISTNGLKSGIEHFCNQFKPEFNNTGCVSKINIYTSQFQEDDHTSVRFYKFYPNMLTAIISSEIGIWAWIFQIVLCVLRIFFVADFDLQLVTISSKEEGEEEEVDTVELSKSEDIEEEV